MTLSRVLRDLSIRSAVLLVVTEGTAGVYAALVADDDGLGTGLTAMFVLVVASAAWGLWDGFRRPPLQLCLTWAATGVMVLVGTTLYGYARYGGGSATALAADLGTHGLFWAGLVGVPAVALGIAPALLLRRERRQARVGDPRALERT